MSGKEWKFPTDETPTGTTTLARRDIRHVDRSLIHNRSDFTAQHNSLMNISFAAITAKYMGPTNYFGSRIKVTSQRGSKTYSINYELNFSEQHHEALGKYLEWIKLEDERLYADSSGWGCVDDFISGVTNDGEYVYVRKPNQ